MNGGHPPSPTKGSPGSTCEHAVAPQFVQEGISSKEGHSTGRVGDLKHT